MCSGIPSLWKQISNLKTVAIKVSLLLKLLRERYVKIFFFLRQFLTFSLKRNLTLFKFYSKKFSFSRFEFSHRVGRLQFCQIRIQFPQFHARAHRKMPRISHTFNEQVVAAGLCLRSVSTHFLFTMNYTHTRTHLVSP